jgi:O-antigen ligase
MKFNNINYFFYFFKVSYFLVILLPFFLITGSFLPDLAISLVALCFIIYSIKYREYQYYKGLFFRFFLIFCTWILICSLLSNNILLSFQSSLFYFRFGIFSLAFLFLIKHKKNIIFYLFISFLIFFLCLIFDSFIQYFYDKNILGWNLSETGRVSSFFGKELILGSYISRLIPIFSALFCLNKNIRNNSYLYFLFIITHGLSGVLIFLSGERSAFFYFILYFFIILFLISKSNIRVFLISFFISFFVISIFIILDTKPKQRMIDQTLSGFKQIENNQKYMFTRIHQQHYNTALKMFVKNKIFGIGPKNFRVECSNVEYNSGADSCTTHPHNTYIQLLAETGIFGFLFVFSIFLSLSFFLLIHLYKKFVSKVLYFDDFQICILSSILITIWPLTTSGSFFHNWLCIIYFMPVGLLLSSLKKN